MRIKPTSAFGHLHSTVVPRKFSLPNLSWLVCALSCLPQLPVNHGDELVRR